MREKPRERSSRLDTSGRDFREQGRKHGLLALRNNGIRTGSTTRRISKFETFNPYLKSIFQETISFFFNNLPDNWGEEDFRRIFGRYGTLRDVFIPKKLDRKGQRYGFARFKDVEDVKKLENALDSISIGGRKLNVNLAKYSRFEQENIPPSYYRDAKSRVFMPAPPPQENYWEARAKSKMAIQTGVSPKEDTIPHEQGTRRNPNSISQWEREENYGEKWRGPQFTTTEEDRM